jgi:DNA repair exonuclease SbcCD ATPase subunit
MGATLLNMPASMEPVITLRQRIADALTKPTTPAELRSCIAHSQADLARVERERERAEAVAVDPLSTEEQATEARRDYESRRFDAERLTASVTRLDARLSEVTAAEEQAARQRQYDAALAVRDSASEKLRTLYPQAVALITDALATLAEAEAAVLAANRNKPTGADHIMATETHANGGALANGRNDVWPIAEQIQLPRRFGSGMWPLG